MIEHHLLQGLRVCLEASSPDLLQRSSAILRHLGGQPVPQAEGPADLSLSWTHGVLQEVGKRGVATHLDVRASRDDRGTLYLDSPTATCAISEDGKRARGRIRPGEQLPLHFLTYVLVHQLRGLDWFMLHAGGIAQPSSPRGCLIIGASGVGKSTLALSMVKQGWSLLSDDSVLLHQQGDTVMAHALRRGVYLEPGAAARTFPALGGKWHEVPLVEACKHGLASSELLDLQIEQCQPVALLFPTLTDSAQSELEPLSPSETLFGLVLQSRLAELDADGTARQMAALAALATSAQGFRFRAGRDVFEDPGRVSSRLQAVSP